MNSGNYNIMVYPTSCLE